jgi:hypothetical protein
MKNTLKAVLISLLIITSGGMSKVDVRDSKV